MEYKANIRVIPEHIIYFKEYFVKDLNNFFASTKEHNFLQELSDKVMFENPEIQLTDPDYNVVLFIDGEYEEANVRIEFCDAVTGFGKNTKEYSFRIVPAFIALNVLHKGPYEKIRHAYDFANQWMKENGYRQAGCPRSSAIDGFWNRNSEEDYLTEIQIPIDKHFL